MVSWALRMIPSSKCVDLNSKSAILHQKISQILQFSIGFRLFWMIQILRHDLLCYVPKDKWKHIVKSSGSFQSFHRFNFQLGRHCITRSLFVIFLQNKSSSCRPIILPQSQLNPKIIFNPFSAPNAPNVCVAISLWDVTLFDMEGGIRPPSGRNKKLALGTFPGKIAAFPWSGETLCPFCRSRVAESL